MTVSNLICTLACFLIPFLLLPVSALFSLPAEEIRKVLPRVLIELLLGPAAGPVNTDGWAATRNAFQAWFPWIEVVLCFPHGSLKSRNAHQLRHRVRDIYCAAAAEGFRRLITSFSSGVPPRRGAVREMLTKPEDKTEPPVVAYDHPGRQRTSNAVEIVR